MEFIVIPKELMKEVPGDILTQLSLEPRENVDGTEIMLHLEYYNMLFPQILSEEEEVTYPFPVYNSPSTEFDTLLNSTKWTITE